MDNKPNNSDDQKMPSRLTFQARHRTGFTLLMGAVILISGIALGSGAVMIYFTKILPAQTAKCPVDETDASGIEDQTTKNPQQLATEIAKRATTKANAATKRFAKHYNFTKEQTPKVRKILQNHIEVMLTREQLHRSALTAEYADLKKQLKSVLTEKQYNRWIRDFGKRMRNRFPKHYRRRPRRSKYHFARDIIRIVDRNKDKQISADEIKRVQIYRIRRWLEEGDKNKDRKLDQKEISEMLERVRKASRKRPPGKPPRDEKPEQKPTDSDSDKAKTVGHKLKKVSMKIDSSFTLPDSRPFIFGKCPGMRKYSDHKFRWYLDD